MDEMEAMSMSYECALRFLPDLRTASKVLRKAQAKATRAGLIATARRFGARAWVMENWRKSATPPTKSKIRRSDMENANSYKCLLCGQRIDDGLPCGCGARPVVKDAEMTAGTAMAIAYGTRSGDRALAARRLHREADMAGAMGLLTAAKRYRAVAEKLENEHG